MASGGDEIWGSGSEVDLNLFPLNLDVIYFSSRTKNMEGGASRVMFRC